MASGVGSLTADSGSSGYRFPHEAFGERLPVAGLDFGQAVRSVDTAGDLDVPTRTRAVKRCRSPEGGGNAHAMIFRLAGR